MPTVCVSGGDFEGRILHFSGRRFSWKIAGHRFREYCVLGFVVVACLLVVSGSIGRFSRILSCELLFCHFASSLTVVCRRVFHDCRVVIMDNQQESCSW